MASLSCCPTTVIALAGFALVRSPCALAQNESCLRRTVSVAVADRNWAPIPDLKPVDFRAEYRGKPVKILSVVPDNRPNRIVMRIEMPNTATSGACAFLRRNPAKQLESSVGPELIRIRIR